VLGDPVVVVLARRVALLILSSAYLAGVTMVQ